jgi:Flp pilus assembly protein TadG
MEQAARGQSGRRWGTSLLELATVAPLVTTLLLGLLDMGMAVFSYNTVAEAARVGARFAALRGASSKGPVGPAANHAAVEGAVRSATTGLVPQSLTVRSTWIDGDNSKGCRVRIDLNYSYRPLITWVVGFRTLTLSSTCTMTITN